MTRLTFPLSRIEGHAQAVIELKDDQVTAARFQATEYRGFEHLVKGTPAEEMVVIVPRICGVCSTAHHVAAVKALEDAYDVTPPPAAQLIRELLLLGQLIQNQATSLFIFTMPDRLGTESIFKNPDDSAIQKDLANFTQQALRIRNVGTDIIKAAGGQFIHPVKAVIGGMTSGVGNEEASEIRKKIEHALPIACDLFSYYWEQSIALQKRIGTWGDDSPACYIAAVGDTKPDFTGDLIRVMSPDGHLGEKFSAKDFRSYLEYEQSEYSFSGRTSFRGQIMRANSLARINMASSMGTPLADEHLFRFREAFGRPAHGILLFDLGRGIELIYGLERALEILDEPLNPKDTQHGYTPKDGVGYGLVEAPRGPLIHQFEIENGLILKAEFIIPTVHNIMAIEHALKVAAKRYISSGRIDLELEKAVGRVVRAFDPCIACATH